MRVIGAEVLARCARRHADVRGALSAWREDVERSDWETPQDVRDRYVAASFLSGRCVVFDLKGNKYRVVCRVSFANRLVRVVFAGTHAQYNSIDAARLCEER